MAILVLNNITQEFGGLRALEEVSLAVEEKTIFGIIGPNGAGKTTLFNIITGIYFPTEGELIFKDKIISGFPPHILARMGIARTFQNIRLFKKLSVLDNVKIGTYAISKSRFFSSLLGLPASRREEKRNMQNSADLLQLVGLYEKSQEYSENLSYGEQRKLEIARALALQPSLLLLDEPAAGMNSSEKAELMDLIQKIRQEMNLTILLVEHDMNLVMNICERIAVLDYGKKIAEDSPQDIINNERVIRSYLGVEV